MANRATSIPLSLIPYSSIFPCSLPLPPGFDNIFSSAKRPHGQLASVLRVVLKILTFYCFTYAILISNLLLLYLFWTLQASGLVFSLGPATITSRKQQSPCPTSRLLGSTAGIQLPEPLQKSAPQPHSLSCSAFTKYWPFLRGEVRSG